MRVICITAVLLAATGLARAGDLGVNLILSGQVVPGVYGQVQIANDRPPPLVYAQPVIIVQQEAPAEPIYLHVPPGHARHWGRYCHEYHACNRPVYFVRSREYEADYDTRYYREEGDRGDEDHDRGHHGHKHGHGHDEDD